MLFHRAYAIPTPFTVAVYLCVACVYCRERTVQPKLDRSDSVFLSRVRPAIQYRSSTDHLVGGGGGRGGFRLHVGFCCRRATLLTATQLTGLVYNSVVVCSCLLVLSWAALNSRWLALYRGGRRTQEASFDTSHLCVETRDMCYLSLLSPHHALGRSDSGIFC